MENDFDVVVISVKREVKEAVKDNLKVIMTEAVDKIVHTDKTKKKFADVLKNSENIIRSSVVSFLTLQLTRFSAQALLKSMSSSWLLGTGSNKYLLPSSSYQ